MKMARLKRFVSVAGIQGMLLSWLFLLAVFPGCRPAHRLDSPEALRAAYLRAIDDARVATPEEISRNLLAIVPYDTALRWRPGAAGRGEQVLVVTWTNWEGYDAHLGDTLSLERDVWVTAVPQLRDFCRRFRGRQLVLRLEQLLGLPPHSGKTRFVEMWVDPDDLFRPAPDPEITDHEAELDFPRSGRFVQISDTHRRWIENLKSSSYGETGYPWTRLGYTYDWGNPKGEIGLSEFVIRSGAVITIHGVFSTDEYCGRKE